MSSSDIASIGFCTEKGQIQMLFDKGLEGHWNEIAKMVQQYLAEQNIALCGPPFPPPLGMTVYGKQQT